MLTISEYVAIVMITLTITILTRFIYDYINSVKNAVLFIVSLKKGRSHKMQRVLKYHQEDVSKRLNVNVVASSLHESWVVNGSNYSISKGIDHFFCGLNGISDSKYNFVTGDGNQQTVADVKKLLWKNLFWDIDLSKMRQKWKKIKEKVKEKIGKIKIKKLKK